jgi:hypothetical protein
MACVPGSLSIRHHGVSGASILVNPRGSIKEMTDLTEKDAFSSGHSAMCKTATVSICYNPIT